MKLLFWKKRGAGEEPVKEPVKGQGKEKKRLNISDLFYNNHFVMAFSLVAALILWFIMSLTNTTERPREVGDVPISVELSTAAQEENLKVFEQSADTATVSVSGNSVIVNRLQGSDMKATATLSSVTLSSTGMTEYTLTLTPEKVTNELSDYTLVSVNPREVTVWVDQYQEKSFPIESNLQYGRDDKYYYNTPTLSSDSVTISGPASSVKKVDKVVASYSTEEVLTSTKIFQCNLTAYDVNGEAIDDKYLEFSTQTVDVTVSVFPRQEVELVASGINMPKNFSSSRMTVAPEKIIIAGPEDVLKNMTSITLDPVDFSNVNLSNTKIPITLSLPTGFKNISNSWNVEVNIDLDGYDEKDVQLLAKNITVKNPGADQTVQVLTDSLTIHAVGPESEIKALSSDDVYGTIDMTGQNDASGSVELPVTVGFTDANGCWAYGKYTVSVSVSKK